jgi:transposase
MYRIDKAQTESQKLKQQLHEKHRLKSLAEIEKGTLQTFFISREYLYDTSFRSIARARQYFCHHAYKNGHDRNSIAKFTGWNKDSISRMRRNYRPKRSPKTSLQSILDFICKKHIITTRHISTALTRGKRMPPYMKPILFDYFSAAESEGYSYAEIAKSIGCSYHLVYYTLDSAGK